MTCSSNLAALTMYNEMDNIQKNEATNGIMIGRVTHKAFEEIEENLMTKISTLCPNSTDLSS